MAGLGAAAMGARVLMTDLPPVLPLLSENVATNSEVLVRHGGTTPRVRALDWAEPPEDLEGPASEVMAYGLYGYGL